MISGKNIVMSMSLVAAFAGLSQAATISIPTSEGSTVIPNYIGVNALYYSGYYYSSETTETFLRYDLSALAAPAGQSLVVNSASIAVDYAATHIGDPFTEDLYTVANDTWTNSALTWANRPAAGTSIIASQAALPSWTPGNIFDSTSGLVNYIQLESQGDGIMSLMFKASGLGPAPANPGGGDQHIEYYSDPNAGTSPHLVVDYSFVPVPEPVSAGLLGVGMMLLLGSRGRRRSSI